MISRLGHWIILTSIDISNVLFMTPLRKLIIPMILLIAAILLRTEMLELYPAYGQLFEWLPHLIFTCALVFCASFNLSRPFTIIITLLLVYILIQTQLQMSLNDPRALMIYTSISFVFPVTALLLFFISERGLNNQHGMIVISIAPIQMCLILFVYYFVPDPSLISTINTYMPIKPINGYVLSITASLFYLLTFLIGLYKLTKTNEEAEVSILVVLLFSYTTLAFFDQVKISTIMFSAAGLALIVNLVQSSYNMAYRDELTGLLGRRALNDRLKGLRNRFVIAMTDVDHFKKFNDTHGHNIGDEILKMVADKLGAVEGGGTAFRYGGEEFCILFPGKTIDECAPYLEVMRKSVENYKMTVRKTEHRSITAESGIERRGRRSKNRDNKIVSVTISIGVAEKNDKFDNADAVMKAADKALYKAKKSGRNCIQLATS